MDFTIIQETQSILIKEKISNQQQFNSIAEILAYFEVKNTPTKKFLTVLLSELLFYIPFIAGFGSIIYKLYSYAVM